MKRKHLYTNGVNGDKKVLQKFFFDLLKISLNCMIYFSKLQLFFTSLENIGSFDPIFESGLKVLSTDQRESESQ